MDRLPFTGFASRLGALEVRALWRANYDFDLANRFVLACAHALASTHARLLQAAWCWPAAGLLLPGFYFRALARWRYTPLQACKFAVKPCLYSD